MRTLPALVLASACVFWACSADRSADPPPDRLRVDSIVVDLFSLKAALKLRYDGAELTPLGRSLLVELDSNLFVGEDVVLPAEFKVRTYSAHFLLDQHIRCDQFYQGDSALIIEFDNGIPGPCHDTLLAEVPAYPYREPVTVKYLEGKGFWLNGFQVAFARGKLKILFDYFP